MNDPFIKQNRRILVVDDNPAIHADFKKILSPASASQISLDEMEASFFGKAKTSGASISFLLDSAFQGQEGYELVKQSVAAGRPYAMVFMDVRMPPGWDGIETTAKIWGIDPDLQTVICTAHADYSWDEMTAKLGVSDRLVILKKPFDNVEVVQLAHALTEKWRLQRLSRAQMEGLGKMVAARTRELQKTNEELRTEIAEHARTEEALRQSQKMDALGQLAGGIAHDFNNLLTVIRGQAQCLVAEGPQTTAVLETLQQIDAAAERAAKLTSQMLMFGRKKRMERQHLDLSQTLTQFGKMLHQILGANITLEIHCEGASLAVYADPVMIEQVVLNLAVNARDAMPQGGRLRIHTGRMELTAEDVRRNPKARAGQFVCISVSDTGCGITAEVRPHLFEPFFTTKEQGKGPGLGLATVYGIVKQHEGWIEVETEPGRGTSFRIFLPLASPRPEPVKVPSPKTGMAGGKETILLVEDEQIVRRLALRVLQRQGYRVLEAGSGEEALLVWNEHGADIDLLLTDMVMPGGMSGRELAEKLLKKKSGLKVTYTTGYSRDAIGHDLALEEGLNFLAKPYHPDHLAQTIRRCLDNPLPSQPRPTHSSTHE
jgi:two-component system NtrC family sensor kinase